MNFFDMYFGFWDFFCTYPWSMSCFLSFIDLLTLFTFCIMSINPIIRYVENILYQSTTSLSAFYFALYLHRHVHRSFVCCKFVGVFISGFWVLYLAEVGWATHCLQGTFISIFSYTLGPQGLSVLHWLVTALEKKWYFHEPKTSNNFNSSIEGVTMLPLFTVCQQCGEGGNNSSH